MSVTAARGFIAAGVSAGLKSAGGLDLAVVAADRPVPAAGVFTRNRVTAAPVRLSRQALATGTLRAVVVNSGGANACTGRRGDEDARATARAAAVSLGCDPGDVAVASTGVIGVPLAMDRLVPGVGRAVAALSRDGAAAAADAIRTTDTVAKQATAVGAGFVVGGMAKGAGMLAPGLATMLAVLTTDAVVAAEDLDTVLRTATRATFDLVDTDGCMSTNDSVFLLASGAAGTAPSRDELHRAVAAVCADLAGQIVDDAEGATKRLAITVADAATVDDARDAARAIARSALLKCAVHGEDPNWGRVMAALGTSAAEFDPGRVAISINGVTVCREGTAFGDPAAAREAMRGRHVGIRVLLDAGAEEATVLTTDLTETYVHENSAYTS